MPPQADQIVRVRSRQYLVEDVVPPPEHGHDTLVRLSCLADDAQGEALEVLWEREVDARVLGATPRDVIARRRFDDPKLFSAYLHTLRWNGVTSTDPRLFQAPYRAEIEVKAYQHEDEETTSRRRKPWRYRWPDEIQEEVLARLLDLNQKRAEEERRANPTASKGKKAAKQAKAGASKTTASKSRAPTAVTKGPPAADDGEWKSTKKRSEKKAASANLELLPSEKDAE